MEWGRDREGTILGCGQEHYFFPGTTFFCPSLLWSQRVTFSRPKEGPGPGYPPSGHAPWIPTGPRVLFGPGVAGWGVGFSTLSPFRPVEPPPLALYWSPLPPPGHCPGLQVSWAGFLSWRPHGCGASPLSLVLPFGRRGSGFRWYRRPCAVCLVSGQSLSPRAPRRRAGLTPRGRPPPPLTWYLAGGTWPLGLVRRDLALRCAEPSRNWSNLELAGSESEFELCHYQQGDLK